MHSSDKRKPKTIVSPFYALSGSIATPNVSRTPSLHKVASAPDLLTTPGDNINKNKGNELEMKHLSISDELSPLKPLKKRIMTVPTNLSEYHHPFIVLELLLNLPMECHMGITDNLKPMIDRAISEQTNLEKQQNIIIQQQIARIQQTKQQINQYKNVNKNFSINAAPLAIPPTATQSIPNTNTNVNITDNDSDSDMSNEIGNPITTDNTNMNTNMNASRIGYKSIKQFESVLNEGYTMHLIIAIIQALIGAFLSGYNIAVLNVPSLVIQRECQLNMSRYSSLQSFYCLGGLIGALSIGKIADKFGRKCAIIIFDIIFIISGVLLYGYSRTLFGKDLYILYPIFAIGRCLNGIGSGIVTAIIPIYLGEISPPLIRGAIGTLNQLTVAFGLIIAELFGYHKLFGNKYLWSYLFIINIILPIIQIFTLFSLPESPKWLITKNDENEARKILQYLRECSNVDMDLHFTKLINEFQNNLRNKPTQYGTTTTRVRATTQILLYSISISIGLQILQQFSGINSIFYYSNGTLINAGFTNNNQLWIGNILIVIVNFLAVLIPVYLMDKLGRKILLNISLFGMIFSCIGFSICLIINQYYIYNINYGYIGIIFLILYVISFEIGLGPIPWLMMAEITPSTHRAIIVSTATFFNWGSNLLIAQFANKLIQYIQFFPFAIICFIGLIVINRVVPETKGKTEIQIQRELLSKRIK